MPNTTGCPCCGDRMDAVNVTCWKCYQVSDRLTPGTYPDDYGTWTLTGADVDRFDAERMRRFGLAGIRVA
ncbi:hypothetical protein LCGC14_1752240 [marine sediment metagenome]|uniref:Cysteine-rich CPCC domain-containing protein n=1 Tax=marine sediment metagenome TaxID=412755 RepID=A0A0F9K2X8_9ZZZZ